MQPSPLDTSELCSSVCTSINFGPINFPPPVCSSPQIGFASPSHERFIPRSQQLHLPGPAGLLQLFTLPLLPLLLLNLSSSSCSTAWIHLPAPTESLLLLLLLHSMDPSSCSSHSAMWVCPHALPIGHHLMAVHPVQSSDAGPEVAWLSLLLSSPFSKYTLQD